MEIKGKVTSKPRGVRLTNETWESLNKIAAIESKKNENARVTASDVLRHAVCQYISERPK